MLGMIYFNCIYIIGFYENNYIYIMLFLKLRWKGSTNDVLGLHLSSNVSNNINSLNASMKGCLTHSKLNWVKMIISIRF